MNLIEFLFTKYGRLTYADLIIMMIYLIFCIYIGFKNSGKVKTLRDYALGSGSISTAALVATLYATHIGAGSIVGNVEYISRSGMFFALTILFQPLTWLLSIPIYRNIEQFQGCITPSDIMTRLYDSFGRLIMNIAILISVIAVIGAQATVLGNLMHFFLGIPKNLGVFIGIGTLIFYSAFGGIKAVILTDIFQLGLFYVIIPICCAIFLEQVGGFIEVFNILPTHKWNISWQDSEQVGIISAGFLDIFLPFCTAPFLQRFLMSMNGKQITKALYITSILDFFLILTLCLFAFISIIAGDETIAHEHLLWNLIDSQSLSFIKGFFVIGLIAAIMSTADSYLNNAGVLVASDIVGQLYGKLNGKVEVIIAKISTLVIGVLAICLALFIPSMMELLWFGVNLYYPLVFVPIAAGFFGFRTNARSFIASTILAILGVMLGALIQGRCAVLSNILGMMSSAIGLFGFHYIQKARGTLRDVARQEKLYLKQYYKAEAKRLGLSVPMVSFLMQQRKEAKEVSVSNKSIRILDWFRKVFIFLSYFRLKNLLIYSQRSVERFGEKYILFGIFGLCFCVYPILVIHESNPPEEYFLLWKSGINLRVLLGFCCLSIGMNHLWQEKSIKKYMPLYFHFILMCVFPVTSIYSYLAWPEDISALTGMSLAIFAVPLFVDWLTFVVIINTGFILGVIVYVYSCWMLGIPMIWHPNFFSSGIVYIVLSIAIAFILYLDQDRKMKKLSNRANYDALTGLANRHIFNDELNRAISDSHEKKVIFSIISLDIDHFKNINDNYGHDVGDMVLKNLASTITTVTRPTDICARMGGEEFLILLYNTEIPEAKRIAERLQQTIWNNELIIHVDQSQHIIKYTVSMGVTYFKPQYTAQSFLKKADAVLYQAKKNGRNRIEVWL